MGIFQKKCYLCDVLLNKENKTKDHVIPRCFFSENPPNNLITLPCCLNCQKEYHDDEEYFRSTIAMMINPNENQINQDICNAVQRSFSYKEALKNLFKKSLIKKLFRTESGLIIPKTVMEFSPVRTKKVVGKIARGLLFKHRGIKITNDFEMAIFRNPKNLHKELLEKAQIMRRFEDSCSYAGFFDPNNESIWWLSFFKTEAYIVTFIKKTAE